MRQIIELKAKIKDRAFFLNQFNQQGSKHILFVNPNLSGKYLYKMLIPYFKFPELTNIKTAITSLNEFDVQEQLQGYNSVNMINTPDSELMISWATHIVFPFSLQWLPDIYAHIRSLNPVCKILYNVDFNFYELSDKHPLKNTFDIDIVIPNVEDNMYFADTVLVSNELLHHYLIKKLNELVKTNYVKVYRGSSFDQINVNYLPFLMEEKIMLDNVDYNSEDIIFKVPAIIPEPQKEIKKPLENIKIKTNLAAQKTKTKTAKVLKKKAAIKKKGKKK